MATVDEPEIPPHHAELTHTVTAALAAMAVAPVVGSLGKVGAQPGTADWSWQAYGLLLGIALYLVQIAGRHLNEAWRGSDGCPPGGWRLAATVGIDLVMVATGMGVYVRGAASRSLLVGLQDAITALTVAALVSAAVALYSWLTEQGPAAADRPTGERRQKRPVYQLVVAAATIAGIVWLEMQPLPMNRFGERPPSTEQVVEP